MSTVPVGLLLQGWKPKGWWKAGRVPERGCGLHRREDRGNYVLREALENHSARLFAESASPTYRTRLVATAERLDKAYNALARARRSASSADRQARIEHVHISFHMLVAQATKVPVLISAIERSRVLPINQIFTVSTAFDPFPERWHRGLEDTLVEGTPEQAAEAMRSHVRYRQEQVIENFRRLAEAAAMEPRMIRGPQRRAADTGS